MELSYWESSVLHKIFKELDEDQLLELRCLGSRCRDIIDVILKEKFIIRWGLRGVDGILRPNIAALPTATLGRGSFVHKHVVGNASLCSIALRTGTDAYTLRRMNNIMSDHTLASRDAIYVPLHKKSELQGRRVVFQKCPASLRYWFVVLPEEESNIEENTSGGSIAGASQPGKVLELMERALGVDRDTSTYYLNTANGDVRAAIAAYRDDQRWDQCMKSLKKTLTKVGRKHGTRSGMNTTNN